MNVAGQFKACLMTPEQAALLIKTSMFPGQRPLSESHVRYLADLMTTGHFRAHTILAFAYTKKNPKRQCINGQHTLHAIVKSGIPQQVILHEQQVGEDEEIATLYASYDRGRMRSLVDAVSSFRNPLVATIERSHLGWLSGAIPLLTNGFQGIENQVSHLSLMRNAATRWPFIENWLPEMQIAITWIPKMPQRHVKMVLGRAATLAVVLVTLRYQETSATAFWKRLIQDEGLLSGDPAKTLLRFLQNTPALRYKPHIYARYVASAWNAEIGRGKTQKLYARDLTFPIAIHGTPHDGERYWSYIDPTGRPLQGPIVVPEKP